MIPNDEACYAALMARDKRFDGTFFVGVSSTGIYCRPVCPARLPRRMNCTFFANAPSAEQAGYRPCLRCRPELAPGRSRIDAANRLASQAASRIEDGALVEKSVSELAHDLGTSDRHLRRTVVDAFGVSPVEMAQTARLLLAKRLLTDTRLPLTEIAFAAGFGSVRRFNNLFQERYRMSPTAVRASKMTTTMSEVLRYELPFRTPFAWETMLQFLNGRLVSGVEMCEGGIYRRTMKVRDHSGIVTVSRVADRDLLAVEMSASLAGVMVPVLARIKRLFDLDADPILIATHLGGLAANCPGLRVPGAVDPYEMTVRAILGQQITVKAATTLAGRFATSFGTPLETPFTGLTHLFPTPEQIMSQSTDAIASLGIIGTRVRTIQAISDALIRQEIELKPGGDITRTVSQLKSLPGIGEWTAQYIAMRALRDPDAFPSTDFGIYKALGTKNSAEIAAKSEPWRPWRAYAVMHLWHSLSQSA